MTSRLTVVFLSTFFLSTFFLLINISAKESNSEKAKRILDKALKLQETRSYTSVTYSGEGKRKTTTKVFQKLNNDGSTYRRIEGIAAPKLTHITIINTEGLFYLYSGSNIAVKIGYKYKYKKYDKGIKYEIQTGYFQKNPCYIITQKIPCNKDSFAFYMKTKAKMFLGRNIDELRSRYFKNCIVLKIYYIGKNNNFIYNSLKYNKNGKLSSTLPYENVNLNPVLNDNIFNIPKNHRIKIARTQKEAVKLESDIIVKIINSITNGKK